MNDREIIALLIQEEDHVVTVTEEVRSGDLVLYKRASGETIRLKAMADVPRFHKLAIRPALKGDGVLKYGEVIGLATMDIQPGDHVHVHNISDMGQTEEEA